MNQPGHTCVICGGATGVAFNARVLGRHDAEYRYCPACRHLRAVAPHWLAEAYSEAIAHADTGLVGRNVDVSRKLACVLYDLFDRGGRYLDTAGGTGMLTRLMRDVGFDFCWEDPHCANVHAIGFEAAPGSGGYEAVTAIEVLEHLQDPLAFVRDAVARSSTSTLLFTTELFEDRPPPPDWWYYAFNTGQHISFYTARTLAEMARRLDLRLHSARGLHLFTRKRISDRRYRWALQRLRYGGFKRVQRGMHSRTEDDSRQMLARAVALSAGGGPVPPPASRASTDR